MLVTEKELQDHYIFKYVGTYRVMPCLDHNTGELPRDSKGKLFDSFDDYYIKCRKGIIKDTSHKGILAWWVYEQPALGNSIIKRLKTKYPNMEIEIDDCGLDIGVRFFEKDLDKIAEFVNPSTNGKSVHPNSSKNFINVNKRNSDKYTIPKEDLDELNTLVGDMEKTKKMSFFRLANKDFDSIIADIMGKSFNIEEERNNSGYKQKEFIHSIGLWDEYLAFIKERMLFV